MIPHTTLSLSTGWEFSHDGDDAEWLPVSTVPSDVHSELVRHGKIPEPYADLNELAVRWVAEKTWRYRTTFATPPEVSNSLSSGTRGLRADLVFKGLDTFATVLLNGNTILKSTNMFVEHRISVAPLLSASDNSLEIVFEPARRRGLELVNKHPEHDFIVHQTEVSRGPVRKAQCHWGWDWGPILLTCGPWKPVLLETYLSRIDDIKMSYDVYLPVGTETTTARITVSARLFGPVTRVEAELRPRGTTRDAADADDCLVLKFDWPEVSSDTWAKHDPSPSAMLTARGLINDPKLWWPRGHGPQNLYELRLRSYARDSTVLLAEECQVVGFRTVELVQEKDDDGQSFYFRVNNTDVFCGGSCWIPADSFLANIPPRRYRKWMELMAEGNQAMVRIWGGGIYEADAFYEACDELGIMVWQDFAFACASYPTYPRYIQSVETEARQNVRRLGNHASLVMWCGNNEDYQLIETYGLEYNFNDKDPQSWLKSTFPARYIYEHLLPRVIEEESPGSIYHPGSPWGNGTSTTRKVDPTVGDVHQWNMWHGDAKPYQNLPDMGGRFVSEFGMEAYPHLDTISRFVTDPDQRYPGSMTMDFHNKAAGYERRLLTYAAENFRLRTGADDLASFTHLTQVMQADAVSWAYKSWRRHWGVPGKRKCGGVLVWQLNDCWPTISWAIVDYFLVKKPAFYAIKRALEPVTIGVTRKFHDGWTTRPADSLWRRDTGHVNPLEAFTDISFDVWVASSLRQTELGQVVVRFVSVTTGRDVKESRREEVAVRPNSCTDVLADSKFSGGGKESAEKGQGNQARHFDPFVIHASLYIGGKHMASDTSWPDPIKYLDFSDRNIRVQRVEADMVSVSAEKPVKGFVFSEKQGVELSDNGFDLIPGEAPTKVRVQGADPDSLTWNYIGQ